ncbi:hypothetical protein [Pantanalinema sp. GBBB05]|uniref:hypothetical protein n=1 Tax=Pantanalinema sp. GBBB05 TaxID=2604139 RepID=UPI001DAD7F53|nr:hypothetical protein [Pantanalinema sp. GBBB05]
MELSQSLVRSLIESDEQFSVDFDNAWQWIGYSSKQAAKKKLVRNFEPGSDYLSKWMSVPHSNGSTASRVEKIYLTVDCFKSLAMMAGTEKGREVRRYFLDCEQNLKLALQVIETKDAELEKLKLQLEVAQAQERAATAQKQLMTGVQTLEAIAPGLGQLALGRADVQVERVVEVERHIVVNNRGQVVHDHAGLSPTKVAQRLGMRAAKDLKAWLASIGRLDLIDEAQTIITCHHIRTENIQEIERLWGQRQGTRQKLIGEWT